MRLAYYRVSTRDQSIEAQRHAMGGTFDREFTDHGVSGGVMAADRPGFAKLLEQARRGDSVSVYAVDRLGRDALDVQGTVRRLVRDGITVDVNGLGPIAGEVGELILAVLAQVADMERNRIRDRTEAGREAARAALLATGKTHRGKASLGRPWAGSAQEVNAWREAQSPRASLAETARRFGLSLSTVKRYVRERTKIDDDGSDPLNGVDEVPSPPLPIQWENALTERIKLLRSASQSTQELADHGDDDVLNQPD